MRPPRRTASFQVIFGGPLDQDRVGSVAARAVKQILRGPGLLRPFRNLDLAILDWFLSVSTTSGPDILSYILFEPEFISAALRAGIQDAEALLNDYPDPKSASGSPQSSATGNSGRKQRQGEQAIHRRRAPAASAVSWRSVSR